MSGGFILKIIHVANGGNIIPVTFYGISDPTTKEAAAYVDFVQSRVNCPVKEISVKLCKDEMVDVEYRAEGEKFERIRRVTGYLVGTLDRWNDAKQAEERERVKHTGERFTFNEKIW